MKSQRSTLRVWNVIVIASLARSDVKIARIAISNTNDTTYFRTYEPFNLNKMGLSQNSTSPLVFIYNNSTLLAEGTEICRFHFNSTAATGTAAKTQALAAVSLTGQTCTGTSTSAAVSFHAVLLGNVVDSGSNVDVVDSTDSMRVLQHATGQSLLTGDALIAADVNHDNAINAVDAQQILKFGVSTLLSFWPFDFFSTTADSSIVSDTIYRLENVETGQYLAINTTTNACTMVTYNASEQRQARAKFNIVYSSSGWYTIKNCYSNSFLALNSSYQPTCVTADTVTNSMFWRPIKVGDSYYLINRATVGTLLSKTAATGLKYGYLLQGSLWKLHGTAITIRYFYDQMFKTRRGSSGAVSDLNDNRNTIETILEQVFNIDVTTMAPSLKTSYADGCTVAHGSPCSDLSGMSDATCAAYAATGNNSTDLAALNAHTAAHHKNAKANLCYFYLTTGQANNGLYVDMLVNGNYPCGKVNSATGTTHVFNNVGGISYPGGDKKRCGTVFATGTTNTSNNYAYKAAILHEIGHMLGATHKQTGSIYENHGMCVMSYMTTNELSSYYQKFDGEQYDSLFCQACKNEIKNKLKYY